MNAMVMGVWLALLFCLGSCLIGNCFAFDFVVPPSESGEALYPTWAHHHWVWLSSQEANQETETKFVEGFLDRDIPVGAVDIDSQWATGDNDFVWNREKYPQPKQMIDHFHSLGVRVINWVTNLVNTDSPNYAYGKSKGYFLTGLDGDTIHWWHGEGSFIDYTNPEAVDWWHKQMDNVIDMGLDGWKCDGTSPFIWELVVAWGKGGIISEREYSNLYYRDFFQYTRSKNPDALIMSRPVDSYDVIYLDFSPRDVLFAGWVGDQNPTFSGMQDALRNMFHSAWAKYTNFGSDIGGYRCCGPPPFGRTKQLFLRWAQLGAFNSLMENGGDNQHRPWKFDNTNETLDIYRKFVKIHMEMNPYLYSAGNTAYGEGVSVMKPIAEWTILEPSSWDFWLWHDVFVAPMVVNNSYTRDIEFPAGNDYVDWWDSKKVFQGGTTVKGYPVPLSSFPAFKRKGSIIPMDITEDLRLGHGDARSAGFVTLLISYLGNGGNTSVWTWKGQTQDVSYTYSDGAFYLSASAHLSNKLLVLIKGVRIGDVVKTSRRTRTNVSATIVPQARNLNELYTVKETWYYQANTEDLYIHIGAVPSGGIFSFHNIANVR
eukprot:TRINITY_DN11532_c0_g1_i1.p1 TRINITY_DN11532_c0_g1~~TRINITY_DN11532_c0_g1_i1.p1  ORF type:complete len:598 (+),score=88.49 TRINITY_DN11532_c0_g1_i1:106-1899(+)